MANLQYKALSIDEATPNITLEPSSGYDAIGTVDVNYLWDYFGYGYPEPVDRIGNGLVMGALYIDYWMLGEVDPSNLYGTEDELLDPHSFNNFLPYRLADEFASDRRGVLSFRTWEGDMFNVADDYLGTMPALSWRLTEAVQGTSSVGRQVMRFFSRLSGVSLSMQGTGCILKFTGFPTYYDFCAGQTYQAYFVNYSDNPCYFYLLGITPSIFNRQDPDTGETSSSLMGFTVHAFDIANWFVYNCTDCIFCVKYLENAIQPEEGE